MTTPRKAPCKPSLHRNAASCGRFAPSRGEEASEATAAVGEAKREHETGRRTMARKEKASSKPREARKIDRRQARTDDPARLADIRSP